VCFEIDDDTCKDVGMQASGSQVGKSKHHHPWSSYDCSTLQSGWLLCQRPKQSGAATCPQTGNYDYSVSSVHL